MPVGDAALSEGDVPRRLFELERAVHRLQAADDAVSGGVEGQLVAEGGAEVVIGEAGLLVITAAGAVHGLRLSDVSGGTLTVGGPDDVHGVVEVVGADGETEATLDNQGLTIAELAVAQLDVTGDTTIAGTATIGQVTSTLPVGHVDDGWPSPSTPPGNLALGLSTRECRQSDGWPADGVLLTVAAAADRAMQHVMPQTGNWQVRTARNGDDWGAWKAISMPTGSVAGTAPQTDRWTTTWSGSWRTVFNEWRSGDDVYQGQFGGFGLHTGLWGFDQGDIATTLSGATIDGARIRVTRTQGGVFAAQTPTLWLHDHTGPTSSQPDIDSAHTPAAGVAVGGTVWLDVPTAFVDAIVTGDAQGVAAHDADGSPYMVMAGAAELEVTSS